MIEKLTNEERMEILDGFCERAIWTLDPGGSTETTHSSGRLEDDEVPILGRRYANTSALKIICYELVQTDGHDRRRCIGFAGYHNPDALAYARLTGPNYTDLDLYAAIGSAVKESATIET